MKQFLAEIWPKIKPYVINIALIVASALAGKFGLADPAFNVVSRAMGY